MSAPKHQFHLVDPSPWPLVTCVALLFLAFGGIMFMHEASYGKPIFFFGLTATVAIAAIWWRDVILEGKEDKAHTKPVQHGLRMGMMLFILSEVMFFFAFFFSVFYSSMFPSGIWEGDWIVGPAAWPPEGLQTFNPWELPLMNTLILLLSGTTLTWAHHLLFEKDKKGLVIGLMFTVLLGAIFSVAQAYEYHHAAFGMADGAYAANFYLATGFHGFHVIIGTLFLAVCLVRANRDQISVENHLGFEFAAWYWHFVDVVWLFLFVVVYIFGR